jgi:hypothetical protein
MGTLFGTRRIGATSGDGLRMSWGTFVEVPIDGGGGELRADAVFVLALTRTFRLVGSGAEWELRLTHRRSPDAETAALGQGELRCGAPSGADDFVRTALRLPCVKSLVTSGSRGEMGLTCVG